MKPVAVPFVWRGRGGKNSKRHFYFPKSDRSAVVFRTDRAAEDQAFENHEKVCLMTPSAGMPNLAGQSAGLKIRWNDQKSAGMYVFSDAQGLRGTRTTQA